MHIIYPEFIDYWPNPIKALIDEFNPAYHYYKELGLFASASLIGENQGFHLKFSTNGFLSFEETIIIVHLMEAGNH